MAADSPLSAAPLAQDLGVMAFVQASHLCKGLAPELLGQLLDRAELATYGPEALVLCEGDQDDDLFIVFDGKVVVLKVVGERPVELATLERAQIFGEIAVMTQKPRNATVLTRTETRLIRLPGTLVRAVAEADPKFGRRLAALMAGRTKDTEKKLGA